VRVAVGEDGGCRIKGSASDVGEAAGHVDGSCRAGFAEVAPRRLDEVGETARLLCAGHEPGPLGQRGPGVQQRGADGFDLCVDRQAEFVERGPSRSSSIAPRAAS
jgi:hypothetical protein